MKPRIVLNASFSEKKLTLGADYFDCVSRAGGTPLVVPPIEDAIEGALRLAGGVLLVGGPDYVGNRKPMHERRDRFDRAYARAVVARRMPVLAICGGCQLLALACGGTLVEHIPEEFERPLWHAESRRQEIEVEPGTLLASVMGGGRHVVNSHHHQCVRDPGRAMRISARAPDGVVEAVEPAEGEWFALGVQWHPERMPGSPGAEALFRALIGRAGD